VALDDWEQGAAAWRQAARVAVMTAEARDEPHSYGIDVNWAEGGTANPLPRADTYTLLVFVGTEPGYGPDGEETVDGPEVQFEWLAKEVVGEAFPALRLTVTIADRVDEFESGEASFALRDDAGRIVIR
jgi:hypothetical protein